jgi:chemosensory pili system protein ChpA (sensor histidine kinase/response regulator)
MEKTLNLFLADGAAASPQLLTLLQRAGDELGAWVEELRLQQVSARSASALVAAAERLRAGQPLDEEAPQARPESAEAQAAPMALAAEDAQDTRQDTLDMPDGLSPPIPLDADQRAPQAAPEPDAPAPAADEETEALPELDADFEAPLPVPPGSSLADTLELDHWPEDAIELDALLEEPLDEEEPAQQASDAPPSMPEDEVQPQDDAPASAALPLAQVIEFPEVHPLEEKVDDSIKRIGDIEISVPLHNIYLAETDELLRLLTQDLSEWRHEAQRNVNTATVHAAHSLAGSSATVGFVSLHEPAHALEKLLQAVARKPTPLLPEEFDALDAALDRLKSMLQRFALGEMPAPAPEQVRILERVRQDVLLRAESETQDMHSAAPVAVYAGDEDRDNAEPGEAAPAAQALALAGFAASASSSELAETVPLPAADAARMLRDELDPDLLPVFLEEGTDILPQMQALLRAWQAHSSDLDSAHALLRLLHTIKGSARMAGAMRFGQHMHEMESRIEQLTLAGTPSAAAMEDLLGRLDLGLYLFDKLRNPEAEQAEAATGEGAAIPAAPPAAKLMTAAPAVSAPLVRVRADILDRLVNQAGEVSISRSRIESEIAGMQQGLSELTENVSRLRAQLREMEIQAESQMASQMAHSAERGFDPLEFDRFTRLQELTRMMAETVNDVVSVQQGLARGIDGAGGNLGQQARLTRELQQDLMRVRMVQFASIAERLYRVTRQAAKETDKRVNLDIHGSTVEIDRGVLEKMAGPFEHLLRNAVVHGVEARAERIAAGKNEVGELLIEIRQEGNEVVIQFSDDGRGLDLERILEKARQAGLVGAHAQLAEAEVRELIFHPGFSTASEVTELAGRGIGMDVVRSEAAALGGRVSVESVPGKGASFIVRLPLTLAVTQVVVLSTGGNTYALPSVLVEQVQQLKSGALAAAYAEGIVSWQGQSVPLYYLSELLGDHRAAPVSQQYSPVLILRRGDERVAVHVDEVFGNREVVVKNIGPQLARMAGVAGATVLGSGDIVLILDPVPLAQRLAAAQTRMPSQSAELAEPRGPGAAAAPTAPRSQPSVMVVDDSLTVRRVTQRFLTREGYQVMLAKDGVDALEQLQTVTPDVMLVDIEMPRMDGFDLTRNVRGDSRTRHIPIIMITSRTASKHRNVAMELGVNEYLGKPYRDEDLLRLVSGFVRGASPVL